MSLCWHFTEGDLAPGIHTGTCRDAPGGFAECLPAHETMIHPVPDNVSDEVRPSLADPFSVSLHSVTRHSPPPGGRVLGLRGRCPGYHRYRHSEGPSSRRRSRGRRRASLLRPNWHVDSVRLSSRTSQSVPVEEVASWSGGGLRKSKGRCRWPILEG